MPSLIPDSHRDLLEGPIIVAFATIMPDGHPQVTPVWCTYDGTYVIVNATADRQKHHNILARPDVTVMAVDPDNQFRFIEVRGVVEDIVEDETGDNMNSLALLYTGKPKRYGIEAPPKEESMRLMYMIKPTRVNFAQG